MRAIEIGLAAICTIACGCIGARAEPEHHAALLSALPAAQDIPGSERYMRGRAKDYGSGATLVGMHAFRKDGDLLAVHVTLYPTADEAQRDYADGGMTQKGRMPTGAATGRTIGQAVRRSRPNAAGVRHGSFQIEVLDGRCVVQSDIHSQHIRRVEGRPVMPAMTPADMRQVEDLAILTLQRLAKHGYTTVTKPAAARAKPKR